MSDIKKTITINPALFKLPGSKSQTKKNKLKAQNRNFSVIAPNSVKTDFIRRVKQHQHQKQKQNNEKSQEIKTGLFTEDFKNSLDYMKELTQKKQQQQQHLSENINNDLHVKSSTTSLKDFMNTSFQSNIPDGNNTDIAMELPETLIIPGQPQPQPHPLIKTAVPFGCLKNGNKPTYRNWLKQTQKNKTNTNTNMNTTNIPTNTNTNNITIHTNTTTNNNVPADNSDMNEIFENDNNNQTSSTQSQSTFINKEELQIPIHFITKRTKRRKYKCGKSKKYRKVGIVLKSGKMRTKILSEKRDLKFKPLIDVKNELCKNGLLKIGSSAPKPLLYEIYENSTLTGDVTNKNKDVLLHNYLNNTEDR